MSEIINLAKGNGDDHVYEEAARMASKKLKNDYSFIIQVWKHELPENTKHPKVFISTSDENHQLPEQVYDDSFVHIFKQYIPLRNPRDHTDVYQRYEVDGNSPDMAKAFAAGSNVAVDKVTPLPLCHLEGVENRNIPIKDRKFDWSWMGQFNPYTRLYFRGKTDELESSRPQYKNKVLWYYGWNNGEGKSSYTDVINNTKIMPVPIGSGSVESFRFFEAMMCGCVVLNTGVPPTEFYNKAPYVKLDDWNQLVEAMDMLLSNEKKMEEMSQKSKEWYQEFCSPESICDLIVSKLEG